MIESALELLVGIALYRGIKNNIKAMLMKDMCKREESHN